MAQVSRVFRFLRDEKWGKHASKDKIHFPSHSLLSSSHAERFWRTENLIYPFSNKSRRERRLSFLREIYLTRKHDIVNTIHDSRRRIWISSNKILLIELNIGLQLLFLVERNWSGIIIGKAGGEKAGGGEITAKDLPEDVDRGRSIFHSR